LSFVIKTSRGFKVLWNKRLGTILTDELRLRELVGFIHQMGKVHRLIDLGCGERPYQGVYKDFAKAHFGMDLPSSLHNVSTSDVFGLAEAIPFREGSFDIVLCTEVLEHTADPDHVLKQIHQISTPGGYLFLSTPFMVPVHEPPLDFFRYTQFGLQRLLEKNGFRITQIKPIGNLPATALCMLNRLQLNFWKMLKKILRLNVLYSSFNPFLFLGVILPQILYLKIAKLVTLERVLKKLEYAPIGYIVVAQTNSDFQKTGIALGSAR